MEKKQIEEMIDLGDQNRWTIHMRHTHIFM